MLHNPDSAFMQASSGIVKYVGSNSIFESFRHKDEYSSMRIPTYSTYIYVRSYVVIYVDLARSFVHEEFYLY